jgi:O-antigen ligase
MIMIKENTLKIKSNHPLKISHEFLFVIYLWGFTLLRPLFKIYNELSTEILYVFAISIVSLSFIQIIIAKRINIKGYILITTMFFIILTDFIFRSNSLTLLYLYEFIIYGLIPIHLITQVKNPRKILKYFSILSVFAFFLFFLDPFFDYYFLNDYMTFGFQFALPAYFGLYIGRRYFNFRWLQPIELICLVILIVFANRSVFFSVLVFWTLIELFYEKNLIKFIFYIFIFGILIIFIQDFLQIIINFLANNGLYSYSLRNIQLHLINSDWTGLFSGRLEIWSLANAMINENLIIGSGTASFHYKYASYSHNLYLDIMLQYGLLGLIFFTGLLIKSFIRLSHNSKFTFLLGLLLFSLWFPKLFFSVYFYRDITIWSFLAIGFIQFNIKNNILDSKITLERIDKTSII